MTNAEKRAKAAYEEQYEDKKWKDVPDWERNFRIEAAQKDIDAEKESAKND